VDNVPGGNATVGTVSASGLYTAPVNLPLPASVTVRATSQADATRMASAAVNIQSDIAVAVTPAPAVIELGAMQQFTASVTATGNPNRNVNWSVDGIAGGNATVGTVSATGFYTAPSNLPAPAAVTVTATSQADASKSGSAVGTVTSNFGIMVSGPASLNNGVTGQLTATIAPLPGSNPNLAVTWSVNGVANGDPNVGQICAVGIVACATPTGAAGTVEYRAPLLAPLVPTVTVRATSVADASKFALLLITINAVVGVTITPAGGAVVLLGGTQPFSAAVSGTQDHRVVWDVNGIVGGDQNTIGAISNPPSLTGPTNYFAPVNLPAGGSTVTVRATSQADTSKSASANVVLTSNIVIAAATIQGSATMTRAVNRSETLCVTIGNAVNPAVTWLVNGVVNGNATVGIIVPASTPGCVPQGPPGSLTSSFTYTAPGTVPAPAAFAATVLSVADPNKTASVQVTIVPAPIVTVTPAAVTLQLGSSAQFSPQVTGTPVVAVSWSVNGVPNGDAVHGQICVVGSSPCTAPASPVSGIVEYRAPAVAPGGPVTVAAAGADGGNGSATVTLSTSPPPTAPQIARMVPASITAGPASPFLLRVVGSNFVAGSGAGASTILFGSPAVPRAASCSTTECTATVLATEVAAAQNIAVQVQNPDTSLSNSVTLMVVPPAGADELILLNGSAPMATGRDIRVVEPITAGTLSAQPTDISLMGILINNICDTRASHIVVLRPVSSNVNVTICLGGTDLTPANTYSLSGPADIILGPVTTLSAGVVQVTLTIPSTAQPGTRVVFVETPNRGKAAATGALEIR
jgi:hypothetical protein